MSYGRGSSSNGGAYRGDNLGMLEEERRERLMESENDQVAIDLSNKVGALKDLTRGMHSDVQEHNSFLDKLTNEFSNSGGMLGGAMEKLSDLVGANNTVTTGKVVGICLFVFCVLYWILN
eukprot:CFRG2982T1